MWKMELKWNLPEGLIRTSAQPSHCGGKRDFGLDSESYIYCEIA
jgi:hypothetical protein